MSTGNPHDKASVGQKFIEEMRAYAILSAYLWVCFSALILYQSAVLSGHNLQVLPFGTAIVKALIIGKFILIGKAVNIGERLGSAVLLHRIIWKSLATLLLLLVFHTIEELVVGLVHGQSVAEITAEIMARSWLQHFAPHIVMLLILIPLISFEEIDHALGKGTLRGLLFRRSSGE